MKCQRCDNGEEAEFRIVSNILNIKVCADCAREARELRMSLQIVAITKAERGQTARAAELGSHSFAMARTDSSQRYALAAAKPPSPFKS